MKYSQFLEFNQLLESNNVDFETWKNSNVQLIKEADEVKEKDPNSLDTKSGNIITKKGRMRMSLNKQAKKLQEQINKDVADKFLKPINDLKIKVYQKMAEVGKGKQPKEIVAALKMDLAQIQKVQTKQMEAMEKHAQKAIDVNTSKIDGAIEKKELKDTTKADLQSYWSLLTTQIMMNLLQKINVQDDNVIAEVIKDEGIIKAAKQINAAINKGIKQREDGYKKKVDEKKAEIKAKDAEGGEEKPEEGKTEEKPKEEKTEEIK
jgi:hypothetical protein